jgi:hypothetical protein
MNSYTEPSVGTRDTNRRTANGTAYENWYRSEQPTTNSSISQYNPNLWFSNPTEPPEPPQQTSRLRTAKPSENNESALLENDETDEEHSGTNDLDETTRRVFEQAGLDDSFTVVPRSSPLYIDEHILVGIQPVPGLLSENPYLLLDLRANQLYLCSDPYPILHLRPKKHLRP